MKYKPKSSNLIINGEEYYIPTPSDIIVPKEIILLWSRLSTKRKIDDKMFLKAKTEYPEYFRGDALHLYPVLYIDLIHKINLSLQDAHRST